ncbi:MAG: BrnA antitoxin family protein [Candidatus Aminicenantes bacterium]|nr:BrnA antitoxin family protein [Candidatus Aminicenantes bacterium]
MKKTYDFSKGKRGTVVPLRTGKTRITIRIDNEIIAWFRARVEAKGGGSYQAMINDVLKEYVRRGGESLESSLRRIIREELGAEDSRNPAYPFPPGRT